MAPPKSLLLFAIAGLVLASCSTPSEEAQLFPRGIEETSTAALETAALRETILEFLAAYAGSGDTVQPLRALVAGRELRDWVHWLGVQNRHLEGATGELDLRGVRILQIQDDVAAAAVDADVTFRFLTGEEEATVVRSFQSPVILTRLETPGSWAVIDVVRDGRSMTDSIAVLDPPASVRSQGLVVEAVSVYRFTSGTVVNLRIRHVGGEPVRIDRERSQLQVAGMPLRPLGTTRTLAGSLAPGELVQGAFDFDDIDLATAPEGLQLRFHDGREPITLAFPPEVFGPGA